MIVLDEQLHDERIIRGVDRVYKGAVRIITDLAPAQTVIKDELIPRLLGQQRGATLVTINWRDFWQVMETDSRCSYLCIAIPASRALEVPALLSRVLAHPDFRHKRQRCGKLILVSAGQLSWYERLSGPIHHSPLPA